MKYSCKHFKHSTVCGFVFNVMFIYLWMLLFLAHILNVNFATKNPPYRWFQSYQSHWCRLFSVDPTPPEVITRPHFVSPRDGREIVSQWDRSVLHLAWKFWDPDSTVVSHSVNIRSQLTGRLVTDTVHLAADTEVNSVLLLWLLLFCVGLISPCCEQP